MNVSRTAALLLLGTLVVGVALGALGAGALRPRLETRRPPPRGDDRGRGTGGFAAHMLEVIAPRDSTQGARVRVIVERAATRNRAHIEDLNHSLRASVDSMRAELAPFLSSDQRDRLERATNQLPPVRGPGPPGPREDGGRRGEGPPGGGPPPP